MADHMELNTKLQTPGQKKFAIFSRVSKAIQDKERLFLKYKSGKWRLINPCRLGISTGENGAIMLSAFQEDGDSKSGSEKGWKFFDIEEIKAVKGTGRNFHYDEDVDSNGAKKFRRLFCSIFTSDSAFM